MSERERLKFGCTTFRIKSPKVEQSEWQKKLAKFGLWTLVSGQPLQRNMVKV